MTTSPDADRVPGAHPVLGCAAALAWERTLLGGDESREWAAMSRAGRAIAEALRGEARGPDAWADGAWMLVLCGKGHNGGDALIALHHLLHLRPDARALVVVVPGFARLRPLTRRAMEDLERTHGARVTWLQVSGGPDGRDAAQVRDALAERTFALCLDGLFGMQFAAPLRAPADWLLDRVNAHSAIGLRVAVDLPSGLGERSDSRAFVADVTYATGILKAPVLAHPAQSGRIRYLDLGFFAAGDAGDSGTRVLTRATLQTLVRPRESTSDKRTYGHLFVVSGSRTMPGAVLMTVESALRSGAGLVTAFVPESIAAAGATRAPEAMWVPMPETPAGGLALEGRGTVVARAARCTALLIGPGLGRERETLALVQELLRAIDVPTVLDADALQPELATARGPEASAARVLTPHAGELARLSGAEPVDPRALARRLGAILVCKGPSTVVTAGGTLYLSPFGGPVLARGGSGDLLAGLIAGQLAQGCPGMEAAARGVAWHGLAADHLAREAGESAVRVTQILDHLAPVLREVGHG